MHCVQHLKSFERAAAEVGLSEEEVESIEQLVARNPMAGVEIAGTGGCRKIRIAGRGKGKSGGYRVVTFYSGIDIRNVDNGVRQRGEEQPEKTRTQWAGSADERVDRELPKASSKGGRKMMSKRAYDKIAEGLKE